MNIVQTSFVLPPEIEAGLTSGEFVRYGGVVRDGAGRLVKHLDELSLSETGKRAARGLSRLRHPALIASVGLVLVAIIGIAVIIAILKPRRARALVANYNASFIAYLTAVAGGTLDEALIDHLITDSDALNASADDSKVRLVLSTEQSEALVNLVADYTRRFAVANSVPLSMEKGPKEATVTDLRRYLETQRLVLKEAA